MASTFPDLPATLQDALAAPYQDRRSWQNEIAPTYIGLFLLLIYYDQLGRQTLSFGGLLWSLLGAGVGGLLCFGLLYYVPAMWGFQSRQPLVVVATSTFGAAGAPWVPGLVTGLAHLGWFAVSVYVAADVALRGLVACGLIAPAALEPARLGGVRLESPLFLFVMFFWSLSAATLGIRLVRVVAAVLKGYAVFPALVLAGAMIWALPGLGQFTPLRIDPLTAEPMPHGGWWAFLMMIQLVTGFFALSGASAADWGAVSRDARDVRLGGLVGVFLAAWTLAAIPLFTVAGALGRTSGAADLKSELAAQVRLQDAYEKADPTLEVDRGEVLAIGAENFTLHGALLRGVGGYLAAAMLFLLGLALLGPTCFNPFVFGHRFAAVAPRLKRWVWSLIGTVAAWPIMALGLPARSELVFGVLAALVTPVVGAMAADYLRNRGQWPGPRRGVNAAGVLAWSLGCAAGLVPLIAAEAGWPDWLILQPATMLGFVVAFLAYAALAALGLEPRALVVLAPVAPTQSAAPTVTETDHAAQAGITSGERASPERPGEARPPVP
jgi:cytosine permease